MRSKKLSPRKTPTISRRLLFNLVDIVWGEANEDESVPSTEWSRRMIKKAIERTRKEKYSKLNKEQSIE